MKTLSLLFFIPCLLAVLPRIPYAQRQTISFDEAVAADFKLNGFDGLDKYISSEFEATDFLVLEQNPNKTVLMEHFKNKPNFNGHVFFDVNTTTSWIVDHDLYVRDFKDPTFVIWHLASDRSRSGGYVIKNVEWER